MKSIKVPGIGPVDAKYVIAGGAAVTGILAYAWWTRGVSGDGEGGEDGTVEPTDAGTGEWPVDAYVSPVPGGSTVPSGSGDDPDDLPPATNAAWTQRAIEALTAIGYDAQVVGVALGKYLGRQRVTEAQAEIIRVALAAVGPPPIGTYPIEVTRDDPKPKPDPKPDPKPGPKPDPKPKPKPDPKPGPKDPAPGKKPPAPRAKHVTRPGEDLTKIAKKYGTTASIIFRYNTTPGVRTAAAIAKIKARGMNLTYAGSLWYIPPKSWK